MSRSREPRRERRLQSVTGDAFAFGFAAMGCDCTMMLAELDADHAARRADEAIAEIRRIEAKYSRYRDDSVVSRINASAGRGFAMRIDDETADLLVFAEDMYRLSEGLFDITSGVLRRAWDFRSNRVPSRPQVDALMQRVGWHQVRLVHRHGQSEFELLRAGMEIDFGGFGKEYAADRSAVLLRNRGVRHGWVNLGGDIRVIGPRPDGSPWQMTIQHPRLEKQAIASVAMADGGLATSGDYERSITAEGGARYCHVLDPRDGWPVQAWQSVSAVAPVCLAAGAVTTIAMLKGERALQFLEAQGVSYCAVDAQGRLHRSTSMSEDCSRWAVDEDMQEEVR